MKPAAPASAAAFSRSGSLLPVMRTTDVGVGFVEALEQFDAVAAGQVVVEADDVRLDARDEFRQAGAAGEFADDLVALLGEQRAQHAAHRGGVVDDDDLDDAGDRHRQRSTGGTNRSSDCSGGSGREK